MLNLGSPVGMLKMFAMSYTLFVSLVIVKPNIQVLLSAIFNTQSRHCGHCRKLKTRRNCCMRFLFIYSHTFCQRHTAVHKIYGLDIFGYCSGKSRRHRRRKRCRSWHLHACYFRCVCGRLLTVYTFLTSIFLLFPSKFNMYCLAINDMFTICSRVCKPEKEAESTIRRDPPILIMAGRFMGVLWAQTMF